MLVLDVDKDTRYTIQNYRDNMTDSEFMEFCMVNKRMRIERDQNQNIIIMAPLTGFSSYYEGKPFSKLDYWTENIYGKGVSFNSSVGFNLPNGSTRMPDACWISPERWANVTEEDMEKFLTVIPDFVIEVRSKIDRLSRLQDKMLEWIESGVRLAWLINPKDKQSIIYRSNGTIEIIDGFENVLNGEDVAPGFEFDLKILRMPK